MAKARAAEAAEDGPGPSPGGEVAKRALLRGSRLLERLLGQAAGARDAEQARRDLAAWRAFWGALGVEPEGEALGKGLDAPGRGLWLYLGAGGVAEGGDGGAEKRVPLEVRRSHAFADALAALRGQDFPVRSPVRAPRRLQPAGPRRPCPCEGRRERRLTAPAPASLRQLPGRCILSPKFLSAEGYLEGGEGLGPRKELFVLLGKAMTEAAPTAAMAEPVPGQLVEEAGALFTFNKSIGAHWFNTTLAQSPDAEERFAFAGWATAQAVLNRCVLGVALHPMVFARVAGDRVTQKLSLATLEGFDPEAADNLRKVSKLPQKTFAELLEVEGLGKMGRNEYIRHAVQELLEERIEWQSAAWAGGFRAAIGAEDCRQAQCGIEDLATIVAGAAAQASRDLELPEVFVIDADDELHEGSRALLECLYAHFKALSVPEKRDFAKFVTGSKRLPLPGSEHMRIQLPFAPLNEQEHHQQLQRLPQAHTCDNVLELPNYWESLQTIHPAWPAERRRAKMVEIVRDRFNYALSQCQEYSLDDFGEAGSKAGPKAGSASPEKEPAPREGAEPLAEVAPKSVADILGDSFDTEGASDDELPPPKLQLSAP